MQSKKRLTTPTDATRDDIEKYGYHPKSLMNIFKYAAMTKKYIKGFPYKKVLDSEKYISLRSEIVEKEKALDFAEKADAKTKRLIQLTAAKPPNEKLSMWLDAWIKTLIGIHVGLYEPL